MKKKFGKLALFIMTMVMIMSAGLIAAYATQNLKTIGVGAQTGTVTTGTAGAATYTVTIGWNGSGVSGTETLSVNWSGSIPAGLTTSFLINPVTSANTSDTLTISTDGTTPEGAYSFTVNGGGKTSGTATFTVLPKLIPTVTAWPTASNITYGQSLAASALTGGSASVAGAFAFTALSTVPTGVGTASYPITFAPTDTTHYSTVSGSASVTVGKATPVITWSTPADIAYGTALSGTQLNATASAAGTSFVYSPAAGTVLDVGTHQALKVIFTPTDTAHYTTATGTVYINVNKITPSVTAWPTASAITYRQTLASSTLTDGSASVPGSFAFTTPATAPNAGTASQAVTFTPADTAHYNTVSSMVSVAVSKATPTVSTWPAASAITYGQTLANATLTGGSASVGGSFAFTTPAAAPNAGTASQSVIFTPTDTSNFSTVGGSVSVTVNKVTPVITWNTPADIAYGTALSGTQLNATASAAGTSFVYSPAAGTVLDVGTHQALKVTFTPTDTANYTTAEATVYITVNKATPVITWGTPADITYGTALGGTQLNASVSVAGTSFVYAPAAGTVLDVGMHQALKVTFTPANTANYTNATATVYITVNQETPDITWPAASGITFGQTLASSALTGGSASVLGTFAFTAPTTAPDVGTASQSVTFTPTDTAHYTAVSSTVSVAVSKATSAVNTWPAASAITYGQTLANATLTGGSVSVGGSFAFTTPTAAPNVGTASQSVIFTPTDTAHYNSVSGTVNVTVASRTASVTPNAVSKDYGAPDPLLTGILAGFLASDNVTATYSRTPGDNYGTYTISATLSPSGVLGNYNITYNTAVFTVTYPGFEIPADTNNVVTASSAGVVNVSVSGGTTVITTTFAGTSSARPDDATMKTILDTVTSVEQAGGRTLVDFNLPNAMSPLTVTIPNSQMTALAATNASLMIGGSIGSVTFNAAAVDSMAAQAGTSDTTFSITQVSLSSLTTDAQLLVGSRPVYDISVTAGGTKITTFGATGLATVTIPYTLAPGEDPNNIVIYYMSASGPVRVSNCVYDTITGAVSFTVSHLSTFGIGYKTVILTDISGWYVPYVNYLVSHGIMVCDGKFYPDNAITRADVAVALANMAGADLSLYTTAHFSDVKTTDSCFGSVEWAYANGIITGYEGKFSPNASITRQDFAVMMMRYAAKFGYTLPSTVPAKTFPDSASVASYAKDAVSIMQRAGIFGGRSDGSFAPTSNTTRAEAAKIIAVFMQLLIVS